MSNQTEGQEPTMEEILASIRKIISEDGGPEESPAQEEAPVVEEPPVAEAPVVEAPAPVVEEAEEEILELTPADAADDVMELTEAEAMPEPEPTPAPEPEPVPEPAPKPAPEREVVEDDIAFAEPAPEPEVKKIVEAAPEPDVEEKSEPEPEFEGDRLLSSDTEQATSAAFGALASSMLTSSGSNRTLEDLVAQMLKPMLKAWLDENLPGVVQELVKEEIERVARRRS